MNSSGCGPERELAVLNAALREYVEGKAPKIEDTLRRIIREELVAK
jgi:hypothetical protein